jgi:hypothetical protein
MLQECEWCNSPFEPPLQEIKRGNGRFCSLSCVASYGNSLRPLGTSTTQAGRIARNLWIERHNGTAPMCRVCGNPADIHHKDGNRWNNEPDNHDPLCRSHHVTHENHVNPKRKKAAKLLAPPPFLRV